MQVTLGVDSILLIGAILALSAVFVSALVTRRSRRIRVPGALLFLALGMLFGDDGLNLISLDDPELVQNVGVVALLVILLEGGLTTKPTDLRLAALPGLLLATLGVLITAGITALGGVWLLLDVDPVTAGLIGAVVSSTDAAAGVLHDANHLATTTRRRTATRRVWLQRPHRGDAHRGAARHLRPGCDRP